MAQHGKNRVISMHWSTWKDPDVDVQLHTIPFGARINW